MHRHSIMLALLLFVLLAAQAQPQGGRRGPRRGMASPMPMVHDPVMALEDSTYHLFSTGWGIQHSTSPDGRLWRTSREPVMTVVPQWTRDSVPGFEGHVWAPDIIRWHDRWLMAYSCSTFGRNGSAIGLLTTRSLNGRSLWMDQGCIVCSREGRDPWNAIDPNFVVDDADQLWLTFGSFWDGIQLVRLDTTFHVAPGCAPTTIARRHAPGDTTAEPNPTSKYAGTNAIEAPFILRHAGYYYLFVSWDYCCRGAQSNYRVVVGRSKSVEGPYVDRTGKPMLEGGGTLVLAGDNRLFNAAGHCAAYHLPDRDAFICHGYGKREGEARLINRTLEWTTDGWPQLKR